MGTVRTRTQRQISRLAKIYGEAGYETWRVFSSRAETTSLVWLLASMANEQDPYSAYQAARRRAMRVQTGEGGGPKEYRPRTAQDRASHGTDAVQE